MARKVSRKTADMMRLLARLSSFKLESLHLTAVDLRPG
jgi:hypothetical protein